MSADMYHLREGLPAGKWWIKICLISERPMLNSHLVKAMADWYVNRFYKLLGMSKFISTAKKYLPKMPIRMPTTRDKFQTISGYWMTQVIKMHINLNY